MRTAKVVAAVVRDLEARLDNGGDDGKKTSSGNRRREKMAKGKRGDRIEGKVGLGLGATEGIGGIGMGGILNRVKCAKLDASLLPGVSNLHLKPSSWMLSHAIELCLFY